MALSGYGIYTAAKTFNIVPTAGVVGNQCNNASFLSNAADSKAGKVQTFSQRDTEAKIYVTADPININSTFFIRVRVINKDHVIGRTQQSVCVSSHLDDGIPNDAGCPVGTWPLEFIVPGEYVNGKGVAIINPQQVFVRDLSNDGKMAENVTLNVQVITAGSLNSHTAPTASCMLTAKYEATLTTIPVKETPKPTATAVVRPTSTPLLSATAVAATPAPTPVASVECNDDFPSIIVDGCPPAVVAPATPNPDDQPFPICGGINRPLGVDCGGSKSVSAFTEGLAQDIVARPTLIALIVVFIIGAIAAVTSLALFLKSRQKKQFFK